MKQTSQEIADKTIENEYHKLHPVKTPNNNNVNTNNAIQLIPENNQETGKKSIVRKLTQKEQEYILQSSACFISNQLQADTVKCNYTTILKYQKSYAKEILQLRDIWISKLSEEPFTHKRVRIRQFQDLYQRAITLYDNNSEKPGIQDSAIRRMESILNSSRLEIEGNRVNVKYDINVKYDDRGLIEQSKEIIELADYEEID